MCLIKFHVTIYIYIYICGIMAKVLDHVLKVSSNSSCAIAFTFGLIMPLGKI